MMLIKYISNGVETVIESDGEDNILESLIKNKIDGLSYMCRSGYCSYCKCIKMDGDIEYSEEPVAYIKNNEMLPCISHPKGNITIVSMGLKKA